MIIGFPLFLLFKARHFCRAIIKFGEVLLSHFFLSRHFSYNRKKGNAGMTKKPKGGDFLLQCYIL